MGETDARYVCPRCNAVVAEPTFVPLIDTMALDAYLVPMIPLVRWLSEKTVIVEALDVPYCPQGHAIQSSMGLHFATDGALRWFAVGCALSVLELILGFLFKSTPHGLWDRIVETFGEWQWGVALGIVFCAAVVNGVRLYRVGMPTRLVSRRFFGLALGLVLPVVIFFAGMWIAQLRRSPGYQPEPGYGPQNGAMLHKSVVH